MLLKYFLLVASTPYDFGFVTYLNRLPAVPKFSGTNLNHFAGFELSLHEINRHYEVI